MIDDTLLEEIFQSAGDSIAVPSDGASSVRAARDSLVAGTAAEGTAGRRAGPSHRGVWLAAAAVIATVAAVGGLLAIGHSGGSPTAGGPAKHVAATGASSGSRTGGMLSKGNAAEAPRAATSCGACKQATGAGALSGQASGAVPSGEPAFLSQSGASASSTGAGNQTFPGTTPSADTAPNEVPSLPTKVIEAGAMSLQVGDGKLQDVLGRLSDLASAEGGFVASSSTNAGSSAPGGSPASGSITVRVPVAHFTNLVDQARLLGTVLSATTSGQDVTSQYVDLQARIQALTDTRSQFEQVLAKAYSIGDILSVESQISDLQTQIEQLQGQLEVLQDQTSYSTLAVQVTEVAKQMAPPPKAAKPPSGVSKAWARARHSFSHGVEAVIAASGGIAVFLLFATIVALGGRIGWLRMRRYLV